MKVEVDGFEFDFSDALAAFVFDEKDAGKETFHGLSHAMKAVDLVVELEQAYLFIEVKDFHAPDDYDFRNSADDAQVGERRKRLDHLREVLKHKFRDSYLYRWAEQGVDKPVHYLCLLTLENGLLAVLKKELQKQLPVGCAGPRWKTEIARSCAVLNVERWNKNFPKWPVSRLSGGDS